MKASRFHPIIEPTMEIAKHVYTLSGRCLKKTFGYAMASVAACSLCLHCVWLPLRQSRAWSVSAAWP